jgi:hypothetical protein
MRAASNVSPVDVAKVTSPLNWFVETVIVPQHPNSEWGSSSEILNFCHDNGMVIQLPQARRNEITSNSHDPAKQRQHLAKAARLLWAPKFVKMEPDQDKQHCRLLFKVLSTLVPAFKSAFSCSKPLISRILNPTPPHFLLFIALPG